MPEILEIEFYRRAAGAALHRKIASVDAPDDWYLKGVDDVAVRDALVGTEFSSSSRRGKLLMLHLTSGPTVGLRFGMTGRLIVDDTAPIEKLEYASGRNDPEWVRFGVGFADGGHMVMSDPRRLGGVTLDPDLAALGPDAWDATAEDIQGALGTSSQALKARLLNQKRLAGLGNLLTDEILWRAGFAPDREARSLSTDDVALLHATVQEVLSELDAKGGSHQGDLQSERSAEGRCPRDGAELTRTTIGGRTTWWCPEHQQ